MPYGVTHIRKVVVICAVPALCAAALMAHTQPAEARTRAFCESFAHDYASRRANTHVIGNTLQVPAPAP